MALDEAQRAHAPAGDEVPSREEITVWTSLVRRIGQGDRDAEAELAQQFHQPVRLLASVRLHGSDAALDIAQETILAVLEALRANRLREPEKLPAFVLGIARNLVNNHFRKDARSRELLDDLPEQAVGADPNLTGLEDEQRALVRRFLARLNALDRRILLLTLTEGMTPREIAPIVGLKPSVVWTRKARAVKAIAEELGRDMKPSARPHR